MEYGKELYREWVLFEFSQTRTNAWVCVLGDAVQVKQKMLPFMQIQCYSPNALSCTSGASKSIYFCLHLFSMTGYLSTSSLELVVIHSQRVLLICCMSE